MTLDLLFFVLLKRAIGYIQNKEIVQIQQILLLNNDKLVKRSLDGLDG